MEERNLVISINLDENKIASRLKEINKNIETLESRPTKNLPSEYTEVEYIMSTKKQYIDTGVYATPTTEIVMYLSFENENSVVDSSVGNAFLGANDLSDLLGLFLYNFINSIAVSCFISVALFGNLAYASENEPIGHSVVIPQARERLVALPLGLNV